MPNGMKTKKLTSASNHILIAFLSISLSDAKTQNTTNDDMPYFFYFRFLSTWKINKKQSQPTSSPKKESPAKKGSITSFLIPKMKPFTVIFDWGDIEVKCQRNSDFSEFSTRKTTRVRAKPSSLLS
jgi:hypothetical protein